MTRPVDPPVSFSTFLISLASSALAHMGQVESPEQANGPVDLRMARHTLDLIEILADKTRGNLDDDEQKLLDALRKELADRFAAAGA